MRETRNNWCKFLASYVLICSNHFSESQFMVLLFFLHSETNQFFTFYFNGSLRRCAGVFCFYSNSKTLISCSNSLVAKRAMINSENKSCSSIFITNPGRPKFLLQNLVTIIECNEIFIVLLGGEGYLAWSSPCSSSAQTPGKQWKTKSNNTSFFSGTPFLTGTEH